MRATKFLEDLTESLIPLQTSYKHILCLGIGRVGLCQIALHQLCLLLELKDALRISTVSIYDPVFTKQEKDILTSLGLQVLEENLQGKHEVNEVTLAYFPHCPHELTDSFIGVNWSVEKLQKIVLLCNSFERFTTSEPTRVIEERTPFIARITDYTDIKEVKNSYRFQDVFNDTAVHWFKGERMEGLSGEFWEK